MQKGRHEGHDTKGQNSECILRQWNVIIFKIINVKVEVDVLVINVEDEATVSRTMLALSFAKASDKMSWKVSTREIL